MTAKDFEFDPAVIHLKVGDIVRLQVISSDRTHGLHISAFPDGAKVNTPPGLAFIFGEDCWKLKKANPSRWISKLQNRERIRSSAASLAALATNV